MPLRNQPLHLRIQVTENWVKEVIAFANLENPDDIRIPTMLRTVDDGKDGSGVDAQGVSVDPEKSSFIYVLPEFTGVLGHEGLSDSQARLREVLNTVTAHGKTSEVDQLISDRIDGNQVPGALTYREGYLRFQPFGNVQHLDQWWAVGIATLLDAGMGDRVRQCRWVKCSFYFVDWPGRKGQAKRYCCPEHQNTERQRRSREAAKSKRRLQKANQSMGN